MPYHADSTTRALFIRDHIHTPATLQEVLCSLCRQRCTGSHQVVQITAHPECQCVFGQTCLLQWLASDSAASNTCPSCKAVLYNAKGYGSGEDSDSDSEGEGDGDDGEDEDGEGRDDGEEGDVRGRRRSRQQYGCRTRRHRRRSSPSSPPSSSPSSSLTLSASSTVSLNLAVDTLVSDLWAGTWDLVTQSWSLTPADAPRSRSITHTQLVILVHDVNPFEDDLENAVVEHLVIRARKMVVKHRRNGLYDDGAVLRAEREDVRLAVGYGV
jgi:hypothetical protein